MKQRFNTLSPKLPQLAPPCYSTPNFGQKQQFFKEAPTLKILTQKGTKRIQVIVGAALCCCHITDTLPLHTLSSISSHQSNATDDTKKSLQRCVDHLFTFLNGTMICTASDMGLWVHSDRVHLA